MRPSPRAPSNPLALSRRAGGMITVAATMLVSTAGQSMAAENQGGAGEDLEPAGEAAKVDAARIARQSRLLPLTLSPRVGDELVTGHVWGGYDGGLRSAVGEAVVEGKLTPLLVLRLGASSYDLWGRRTAIFGARVGLLRQETAPFDLGVGLVYQPQSIRGDGLVTGTVSFGRKIGRLSSLASVGYGQDPEGDDRMASASLGAVVDLSRRVHLGLDSRVRLFRSNDRKFDALAEPTVDFCAGPLLAYSIGAFDIIAHGGLAGLRLAPPRATSGESAALRVGPLALLSFAAAL